MSTRLLLEMSWRAHQRRLNVVGVLKADAASCAGQLLEAHSGDARTARNTVPEVPPGTDESAQFWVRVRKYLAAVVDEEIEAMTKKTGS